MDAPEAVFVDLTARLRTRAADPGRRVDPPRTTYRHGVVPLAMRDRLDGIAADLGGRPSGSALPPPATEEQLDAAERTLGARLPPDLRAVYRGVADGGFGPAGGLMSIEAAVATWQDLRRETPGPPGSRWPVQLLPVLEHEGGSLDCVALDTAAVVAWDPDGPIESGRRGWERSFAPVADSLASWLEAWLRSRSARGRGAARRGTGNVAGARPVGDLPGP